MFAMNHSLLARFERGEAMRLNIDEAICTKTSSRGFLEGGPFGHISSAQVARIRRRELTLSSDESFVPIKELREDLKLAEAISVIGLWCGREAKVVLFSVAAALTAKQIIKMSKNHPDDQQIEFGQLKKRVCPPLSPEVTAIPRVDLEHAPITHSGGKASP
jgi:hypothetical protein